MSLMKIRQGQISGLEKVLNEITNQIKTFKPPIDLLKNMPLENNNNGDMRVCLEDSNIYVWNNNEWNINTVKGSFSRTKFILISESNQTIINTNIRFDNVGEDRTNNETINLYLNGILIESDKYKVTNFDNEMIIEWLEKELPLISGDLIGIEFYDITGGLKLDIPTTSPGTNDSNVIIVGEAILPKTNKTVNIGSEDLRFKSIYVDEAYLSTNTLYIGDVPVLGTEQDNIVIKADPDQSVLLRTYGIGDSKICSDNNVEITSKGIGGNVNIKSEGTLSKVNLTSASQISLDSPTINLNGKVNFDSVAIQDLVVRGNLTVDGTTTTINSSNLSVSDNIIEINKNENGNGVSLKQAGIKVNRGDLDSYFIMFDEDTDNLKIGEKSNLQNVATQYWVSSELSKYTGDMHKSIYDTNNNGIVDKAEALYGCKLTPSQINGFYDEFKGLLSKMEDEEIPKLDTAILDIIKHTQSIVDINQNLFNDNESIVQLKDSSTLLKSKVEALEINTHNHDNKTVIDGLTDVAGILQYNGLDLIASGAGDMKKEVYDIDNDGIIDKAKTLDGLTALIEDLNKTAFIDDMQLKTTNLTSRVTSLESESKSLAGKVGQLETNNVSSNNKISSLESKSHNHDNKIVMDKLGDVEGRLQYNGVDLIASGSGDMKTEVYDVDNDGIIDKAKTLNGLTVTIEDLNKTSFIDGIKSNNDAINQKIKELELTSHNHENSIVINKLSESNGNLQYDGKEIVSTSLNGSVVKLFETNAMFPLTSEDEVLYIALNNNGTGLACIYIGKSNGYVNLYDGIGSGSDNSGVSTGSGDMLRSIYDKDKNGIVDMATNLVGLNLSPEQINTLANTVEQLQVLINTTITDKLSSLQNTTNSLYSEKHAHSNLQILTELKDQNGSLYYKDKNLSSSEVNLESFGDMKKSYYDSDNDGIIDKAKTIDGLTVTTKELNYLTGTKSNIQDQINALTIGYSIKGTVATYAKLIELDLASITTGDAYIVEIDETKGSQKTNYVRGTNDWVYLGVFEVQTRDFTTNPINIATETFGTIQEEKIPNTIARTNQLHTHNITEQEIKTSIEKSHVHNNFSLLESIMINDANELFIGGNKIYCNVEFYPTDDHLPIVGTQNVLYIVKSDSTNSAKSSFYIYLNGSYQKVLNDFIEGPGTGISNGVLNQITKLNVVAPKEVRIQIKETSDFNLPDINVLKFIPGDQNVVNSICDFNNSDSTDFEENVNVIFDGAMRLKTDYELDLTQDGELSTVTFNKSNMIITKLGVM